MNQEEWFKDWFNTPFYHELYQHRDDSEAAAFIEKLLQYLHLPNGSRVLDVACGKGRHARQLALHGYDVTGIDLSAQSIAEANKFENESLHFFVHDMRLPFLMNYFDAAFNFFTSFGYFRTRREHRNALRTIGQSLRPGGLFLIDYLNPAYTSSHLVPNEQQKVGSTNFAINRWQSNTHFHKKIVVTSPLLQEPTAYEEQVAIFQLEDFSEMMEAGSLKISEVFGDYHFNQYHPELSPRLIILAQCHR